MLSDLSYQAIYEIRQLEKTCAGACERIAKSSFSKSEKKERYEALYLKRDQKIAEASKISPKRSKARETRLAAYLACSLSLNN